MPDQPDNPATRTATAPRKRPISLGAPASPAPEDKTKRTKLLDEPRDPASSHSTAADSTSQQRSANDAVAEAATARGPGEEDAAAVHEDPVENDAAVATARGDAAADGQVSPLSPGEMAELLAYYALDAERRAEERARALVEHDDGDEDEDGGEPASSPAGGR